MARSPHHLEVKENTVKTFIGPIIIALVLSLLGAGAVWMTTENVGKALTAGGIGLALGLAIFVFTALGARKDAR